MFILVHSPLELGFVGARSQELGIPSRSPMWVEGKSNCLSHRQLPPRFGSRKLDWQCAVTGVYTSTLIWDARVQGSGLIYCPFREDNVFHPVRLYLIFVHFSYFSGSFKCSYLVLLILRSFGTLWRFTRFDLAWIKSFFVCVMRFYFLLIEK